MSGSDDSASKISSVYIKILIVLAIFIPTLYFVADLLLSQVTTLDKIGYQITGNISAEGEQYYNKAIHQQQAFATQGSIGLNIIVITIVIFLAAFFMLGLATAIRRQESR